MKSRCHFNDMEMLCLEKREDESWCEEISRRQTKSHPRLTEGMSLLSFLPSDDVVQCWLGLYRVVTYVWSGPDQRR